MRNIALIGIATIILIGCASENQKEQNPSYNIWEGVRALESGEIPEPVIDNLSNDEVFDLISQINNKYHDPRVIGSAYIDTYFDRTFMHHYVICNDADSDISCKYSLLKIYLQGFTANCIAKLKTAIAKDVFFRNKQCVGNI